MRQKLFKTAKPYRPYRHFKGTMSPGAHAQWSPVDTNLHTTRRGIFPFPTLQKLSKTSQQTASVITKERL